MKFIKVSISYLAFCFAFFLPFSTKLGNVFLGLLLIISVVYFIKNKEKTKKLNFSLLKFSPLLLLFSCVVSLFQVEDISVFVNNFGRRITYLICPLILMFFSNKMIDKIKKNSFLGICYGVFLSSLLMIIFIIIKYYSTKSNFSIDSDLLNYYHTHHYFTKIFDIHPSYYGMYLILNLLVLLFTNIKLFKIEKIVFITISLITILFLNSRVILFLSFIIILFFLFKIFYHKTKNYLISVSAITLLIMLSLISCYYLFKNTYAFQRVVKEVGWELTYGINSKYNNVGKGDTRLARWHAAAEVISEKPLFGYGIGKEVEVLVSKYSSMGMISAASSKYNSHNQYLGFAVEGGILSLLFLLAFFITNLCISFKRNNLSYFLFILSILTICLIENYLIRNSGVIFVTFFSSIFLFCNYNEKITI